MSPNMLENDQKEHAYLQQQLADEKSKVLEAKSRAAKAESRAAMLSALERARFFKQRTERLSSKESKMADVQNHGGPLTICLQDAKTS